MKARGPLSAAIMYGCVFHKSMEYALTGKSYSVQKFMDEFLHNIDITQNNWDGRIMYRPEDPMPNDMVSWMEQAISMCLSYRKTKPQMVELSLSHEYPELCILAGRIDALWDGKIVDFKLAGKFYKPDPLQAACYTILNGGPGSFEFVVIRKESVPRLEVVPIPQVKSRAYLDWVVNEIIIPGAKAVFEGPYPANPGTPLCSKMFCSFYELCAGRVR